MFFLKLIVSISCSILLLIFLNNFIGRFFPIPKVYQNDQSIKIEEKCEPIKKVNEKEFENITLAEKAYNLCLVTEQQKIDQKISLNIQYSWIRAIIVMLILTIIAILMFKRYPFYSSGLILAGLSFIVTYPYLINTDVRWFYPDYNLGNEINSQINLIKSLASLFGFLIITIADLFFFEKKKPYDTNSNISSINSDTPPNTY